ncbi:cobalamin B12-binding domain-containing protein [Zhaonella formicivorans]|uniref:cobalamin B12-binding domain-containing protein n=1 Tax=Zhaonella formicivorans TaxID=2528593 RepID=UPI0010CFE85A|nr:corrinoid protein [Zhaonella formicivorans]
MGKLSQIAAAVIEGKAAQVKSLTEEAISEGVSPVDILFQGLVAGMTKVSERFSNEEFYIPDVLTSSRAVHAGMRVVKPLLLDKVYPAAGKVVIGTVAGDLHDIGKNMVTIFLRANGYEVIDLGIDVHPQDFLEAVSQHQPKIVGMSALLTTTMPMMASTIKLLEETNLREKVKVIIGGAPVTSEYCKAINADGYAPDARRAVELVNKLLRESV